MTPTVGLLGNGFIGKAMYESFCSVTEVFIYDKDPLRSYDTYEKTVSADIIFVSIPTPFGEDSGECDTSILEDCLSELSERLKKPKPIVIRSTIPIKFLRRNYRRWKALKLFHMPEFLTARNANQDFMQSSYFILAGGQVNTYEYIEPINILLRKRFPHASVYHTSWEEAALIKYATNAFFATKVHFFNEIARLADKLNLGSDQVIAGVLRDTRIGNSHWMVPGPDGKRGFGGACLPKDLAQLIQEYMDAGLHSAFFEEIDEANISIRPEVYHDDSH